MTKEAKPFPTRALVKLPRIDNPMELETVDMVDRVYCDSIIAERDALKVKYEDCRSRGRAYYEPKAVVSKNNHELRVENSRLRDALEECLEQQKNHLEDMKYYFENKCIPTADEVNQVEMGCIAIGKALNNGCGEG